MQHIIFSYYDRKNAEQLIKLLLGAGLEFNFSIIDELTKAHGIILQNVNSLIITEADNPKVNFSNTVASLVSDFPDMAIIVTSEEYNQDLDSLFLDAGADYYIDFSNSKKIISCTRKLLNKLIKYPNQVAKSTDSDEKKINSDPKGTIMQKIIEHSSNLFYVHDTEGNFTYVSSKTRDFFDYEPEEFIKLKSFLYSDNPINKLGDFKTIEAIKTRKSQDPFELELVGKNGRKIWVEVHEEPIIENGKVTEIVGALVDISIPKKISDELKESEKKFRTLFEEAPEGAFLSDKKGNIIDCNRAFCEILEYKKHELLKLHVSNLLDSKNLETFESQFPILIKTGKVEGVIQMKTKSGSSVIVRRNASALYDNDGNYTGAIVQTADITETEKYRIKIETSEEQLSTLINASPDLINIKEGSGRWLKANSALINRFELLEVPIENKTNAELLLLTGANRNSFDKLNRTDEQAWNNNETLIIEETFENSNGSKESYEIIKVPVFNIDGSRKVLVTIARNTTRRTQLESQLRHSHKMEAIGLMAGGIAHNFNNILQAIVGYTEFAQEGLDKDSQRFKDIEQIDNHVKRAIILTKDLMAVGKDQKMNKTEIDIADIIQPIVDLTNRNKSNNITAVFKRTEELPVILADGSQIDQVIMNLFLNAGDAMPSGGKLTVRATTTDLGEEVKKLNMMALPGKYVKISISDTGHGMEDSTKRRIFEPYFTTKSMDKGTGLGLSTAFGIISQHKGIINVSSSPNEGSTFDIYLPVIGT